MKQIIITVVEDHEAGLATNQMEVRGMSDVEVLGVLQIAIHEKTHQVVANANQTLQKFQFEKGLKDFIKSETKEALQQPDKV